MVFNVIQTLYNWSQLERNFQVQFYTGM